MNAGDAPPSEGCCHDQPATRPKLGHDKRSDKGVFGAWHTKRNVLFELNEVHGDFRRVFFEHFRALLEETNDEATWVAWQTMCGDPIQVLLVRVERPQLRHFVLGYGIGCFRLRKDSRRCACV